jgi:hypothetical protein
MNKLVSIVAMVVTLMLAWGFDRLLEWSRQTAAKTFDPIPGLWLAGVFNVALAGVVLMVAWLTLMKSQRSLLVSVVFLAIGLLTLVSLPLMQLFSFMPSFLSDLLSPFLPPSPNSLLFHAAAFIAVIGVLGLFNRWHKS